jgi:hypothetical protein
MDDNEKSVTELPEAPAPSETDTIIDAWHREHFAGAATTEAWNHSVKAKEELKKLLAKI